MLDPHSRTDITVLLQEANNGDETAQKELFLVLYAELRSLARKSMRNERQDHTLQPTALVHEAFLRLTKGNPIAWENSTHFFVVAAQTMRRILIDHARSTQAQKRKGEYVDVNPILLMTEEKNANLIALEEALVRLDAIAPRQSRIVELKYFAGLNFEQIASILDISSRTAKREWNFARAWLYAQLS